MFCRLGHCRGEGEGDTCQLYVSFTRHSSGPICKTPAQSMEFSGTGLILSRMQFGTCSNNDYLSRNGSGGLGSSSSALDNEAQALRRKRLAAAEVATTTPSSSTDSGRSERGRTVIGETTRSSASQGQIHNSFSIPNFWTNGKKCVINKRTIIVCDRCS